MIRLNWIKYLLLILIYCFISNKKTNAQQALNLNFETKSVEGINRPWGWMLTNWGETQFIMDSLVVNEGKFSLKTECKNNSSQCQEQSIRFDMESFELKNKKITIEGSIKAENLTGNVNFSIGYTYLDKENNYSYSDTSYKQLSGTFEWTKHSISFFIPKNAISVILQINYNGSGTAWWDNFKLFTGKKFLTELKTDFPPTKTQLKWLNKNSTAIKDIHIVSDNKINSDLDLFKKNVGASEIIALGESTHGTSEFFTLKHKLLQYAITELGFRVFALEDNQLAVENINRYVLTGTGTAKESMSGLFDVWYREEMLEIVKWVRNYNENHPNDKVYFVGFDMQEINRPVDHLISYLETRDKELYSLYESKLLEIKKQSATIYSVTDSTKNKWLNESNELLTKVNDKKNIWLSTAANKDDSVKIILGTQYATLVKQFIENSIKGHWSLYRDEAMAENISWLKKVRYPNSKIVIWAHDVHISRGDHPDPLYNLNFSISMGSFLSKEFKQNYKSYSLSTYQGNYFAMKSYTDFEKISCPLFPGPMGSLDYSLHKISIQKKCNTLFLTLSRNESWLTQPSFKRFANHVSIDYGYWERTSLPYQFDGLFFIDLTKGSTPIK